VQTYTLRNESEAVMSNAAIIRRWFEEVWNQGREETIDALAVEGVISHGIADLNGNPVTSIPAFKVYWRQVRAAIPDIRIAVEDTISEGDKVMARCVVTGTHTGPGFTESPTHSPVSISGMCMVRLVEGRIAEAWNCFDFASLYQQLGMTLR
jgi:predicted ester cyclase